jgi:hypothetical protein
MVLLECEWALGLGCGSDLALLEWELAPVLAPVWESVLGFELGVVLVLS